MQNRSHVRSRQWLRDVLLTMAAGCSTAFVTTASAATLGRWLFDEGSGNVAHDSSGNGLDANFVSNDGAWTTDSPFEPSASNNSFHYLPSKFNVTDAASLNPSGDFTIEGWVKFDTLAGSPYLFSKRTTTANPSGYFLEFLNNNTFKFTTGSGGDYYSTEATLGSGAYASLPAATDTWYHVAGVHTATQNLLYVNGIANGGNSSGGAAAASTGDPLTFGYYAPGDHYLVGSLDEIRLSDTALTAQQLGWNGSIADVPEPVCSGALAGMLLLSLRRRK
jgi:hypothetical protein